MGQAVTDAVGSWTIPVTLAAKGPGVGLRALYAGSNGLGAAVSEPLDTPAPLSLTPPAAAGAPPATQPSQQAAAPPVT